MLNDKTHVRAVTIQGTTKNLTTLARTPERPVTTPDTRGVPYKEEMICS